MSPIHYHGECFRQPSALILRVFRGEFARKNGHTGLTR
jgi:hypothetical protein